MKYYIFIDSVGVNNEHNIYNAEPVIVIIKHSLRKIYGACAGGEFNLLFYCLSFILNKSPGISA